MKLTRRSLFGLAAGAAVAPIAKVLPAAAAPRLDPVLTRMLPPDTTAVWVIDWGYPQARKLFGPELIAITRQSNALLDQMMKGKTNDSL